MRKSFFIILSGLFFFGCAAGERVYPIAPTLIPYTERNMKTAGFWINRHPAPDEIILSPEDIAGFNANIENELKLTSNIFQLTSISAEEFKSSLEKTLNDFSNGYYFKSGRPGSKFFDEVRANMNLKAISGEIKMRFGFIVRFADQRFFPTAEGLYSKPMDIDFDELQNSDLDLGTPVAVVHQSLDGQWLYVESPLSSGWVRSDRVALCGLGEFKNFLSSPTFVVVTKAKADIYLNPQLTSQYDYVRMGVGFPLIRKFETGVYEVGICLRDENGRAVFKTGYLRSEDVHEGYLPYTPRNVIEQAFELLNSPYGWGGMHGEQDCSRFLQEVFATVGITLPRNSSEQARVGKLLAEFKQEATESQKFEILSKQAVGGITLLRLPGHIMLYLGIVNSRPYVIHATWGYREPQGNVDRVRVINRVVVSDLSLGEGSQKGSLLKRLVKMILIAK